MSSFKEYVGKDSPVFTGSISLGRRENTTIGLGSTALGNGTIASGLASHAIGLGAAAKGTASHAEGGSSQALSSYSHAEGLSTKATEVASHTEGKQTFAKGENSHAEGQQDKIEITAYASENMGEYIVENYNDTYNISEDDHLEIYNDQDGSSNIVPIISVGYGSDATLRIGLDLPEVILNFRASLIRGGAIGLGSHSEGYSSIAKGDFSHAEGHMTGAFGLYSHTLGEYTKASGTSSHAEGFGTTASGNSSHAEGQNTLAEGLFSHAEGNETKAEAQAAHTEGVSTIASGYASHAEGNISKATGLNSHAEGYNTTASGKNSHAEGFKTTASGESSHAEGSTNSAEGYASHAEGYGTYATHASQHVQGEYNLPDESINESSIRGTYAHIVGNGKNLENRSNAHTLDWDGNAWFQGNVYVNGTDQSTGSKKLATEEYVDNNGGVFIGTYNSTKFNEFNTAYKSGKALFVVHSALNRVYMMISATPDSYYGFVSWDGDICSIMGISTTGWTLGHQGHAVQHSMYGEDPITPEDIGAAPAYSYGTTDLTENVSPLEKGKVYYVISG